MRPRRRKTGHSVRSLIWPKAGSLLWSHKGEKADTFATYLSAAIDPKSAARQAVHKARKRIVGYAGRWLVHVLISAIRGIINDIVSRPPFMANVFWSGDVEDYAVPQRLAGEEIQNLLLSEVFPNGEEIRRLYCDGCGRSMDLAFIDFSEDVSGVELTIHGLPYLHCHQCDEYYLTDDSRFAIIKLHEEAIKTGSRRLSVTKKRRPVDFKLTDIPFLIDADDYQYIPGLYRRFNKGFLSPLFFNKEVLLKFENSPKYEVRFASQSYGTVDMEEDHIPFGVNRHGKVIMWLGDIAKLSESEQFYLRSENVESDHSIGSEFYDGQIECRYSKPSNEASIITGRTELDQAFEARFSTKLYHLDKELIDTIAGLMPPVVDTEKERKHIFDSLTRILIESMDNAKLGKLLKDIGATSAGSGSLKRLQAALETIESSGSTANALMPFFVLYDLRVAYSHLTSASRRDELLSSAIDRLDVHHGASLSEIYGGLIDAVIRGLKLLCSILTSTNVE